MPLPPATGDRELKVYMSLLARLFGGVDGGGTSTSALGRLLLGDVGWESVCGFCCPAKSDWRVCCVTTSSLEGCRVDRLRFRSDGGDAWESVGARGWRDGGFM